MRTYKTIKKAYIDGLKVKGSDTPETAVFWNNGVETWCVNTGIGFNQTRSDFNLFCRTMGEYLTVRTHNTKITPKKK